MITAELACSDQGFQLFIEGRAFSNETHFKYLGTFLKPAHILLKCRLVQPWSTLSFMKQNLLLTKCNVFVLAKVMLRAKLWWFQNYNCQRICANICAEHMSNWTRRLHVLYVFSTIIQWWSFRLSQKKVSCLKLRPNLIQLYLKVSFRTPYS